MADSDQDKALGRTTTTVGRIFNTRLLTPPGIGVAAAYANLDAIGIAFQIAVPASGVIQNAMYYDLDDEGLQVDLWLLDDVPTVQTDNSAISFINHDLHKVITRIQFTLFGDATNGQFSPVGNIGWAYAQPNRRMWAQVQARGALNIAAGNLPTFKLTILSYE